MHGQHKAAAWCGRLLLFAALLLGIVTMHTLGHPAGHGGGHPAPAAMAHAHHDHDAHPSGPEAHDPVHGGMDPLSVCLAVLGTGWAAALLLSLTAFLRGRSAAAAAVRAWFAPALWPIPPPPRHKALARLSVLRV
ncbi:DUF6153 family protein [Streptomyces morookaense]|uniref:Uncharacterized protein n=1 Tax=Streptomyces morookaense TaxID=1970 RepID=A0A7Y7E721_STRMO|nr:DUF6153 family protein [Streptomyces morookaense]NVK78510.1 hypothetical protein [Streptomyces morookaense]GHF32929.1 hypothetical protein GCM10010359_39530 [Streptomyces morookaense]